MENPQRHFLDSNYLVGKILSLSKKIRYVLVIDQNGEVVFSKITEKSLIDNTHADALAKDVHFLKGLLRVYDDIVGENLFTHLIRAKGHILMFYVRNWILLVSCENMRRSEVAQIADAIDDTIKDNPSF